MSIKLIVAAVVVVATIVIVLLALRKKPQNEEKENKLTSCFCRKPLENNMCDSVSEDDKVPKAFCTEKTEEDCSKHNEYCIWEEVIVPG